MKSKAEIAAQFEKHKGKSLSLLQRQYDNTRDCQAFYAGDIMDYCDKMQFSDGSGRKKRAIVQFNRTKPYVNAVGGFIAQNRQRSKYVANIEGDKFQEYFTRYSNGMSDFILDKANADQIKTQMNHHMLVNGYGAIDTALSYGDGYSSSSVNGEVIIGNLDPLMVAWDPYARAPNLIDKRWTFYQRDYDLDEAFSLFDDSEESDFEAADKGDDMSAGTFKYDPGAGRMTREGMLEKSSYDEKRVKVYFYQWFENETFYQIENPALKEANPEIKKLTEAQLALLAQQFPDDDFAQDTSAEILSMSEAAKSSLIAALGDGIEAHKRRRKVYYTAVISGKHVFTAYKNISQADFTIQFVTGEFDEKNKIWTGMVNPMMQPVLYYNKALTELLFILGANSKGGVMYEAGSIEDIQEFEANYAKTDANVEVSEGALQNGKIRPKRENYSPTGYENIITLSDAAINDVTGIDKSFLGSSDNKQETGILQRRRIKQAIASLAKFFDNITLFEKMHARVLLDLMKVYAQNNAGGLFRLIGEDGRQMLAQITPNAFDTEYEVSITEAPQSPDEKLETGQILTTIADKLLSMGDASGKQIYAVALKYIPLDHDDKMKVAEILTPSQKPVDPSYVQNLEAQIKQLTSDITQAEVNKTKSDMALNVAKTNKTVADMTVSLEEAARMAKETELMNRDPQVEVFI